MAPASTGERPAAERLQHLLKKHVLTIQREASKGILVFPPGVIEDAAHTLLSNVRRSGLLTFVVSARSRWNPTEPYYERVRDLARKGVRIQRLFLLPHRLMLRDEQVQTQWTLDKAAGVDTTFVLVDGALRDSAIQSIQSLDYGLWDDELVCFVHRPSYAGALGGPEWRVSTRAEDVELARATTAALLQHGEILPDPDCAPKSLDLDEPMVRTAPFARMLAEVVCRKSYLAGDTCAWYHKVWQYLRVFDMVSTPTWHREFYAQALGMLRAIPNGRILVSGTADYSTLAHILWYGRGEAGPLHITVVDLCETPLLLCRWYAQREGQRIETTACSILDHQGGPYDAVVTDAFLTRFNEDERRKVVEKWCGLLKVGGRAITTVRLRSQRPNVSSAQVEAFRDRALDLATRWRDFLEVSPDEVAEMAGVYAKRMESWPVLDLDQLRRLFAEAGFSFEVCREAVVKGELEKTVYAEIVAAKT